jgi:hypothetical protein
MLIRGVRAALIGLAFTSVGGVAFAHHSFGAEFDQNAPVVLDGEVTKFDWENPHAEIHLDVLNRKTGQHEHWRVEGGAPSALLRRGWSRDTLAAGSRIIVRGFRAWDGDNRASAAEISLPDGTTISLANPKADKAEAAARKHPPED